MILASYITIYNSYLSIPMNISLQLTILEYSTRGGCRDLFNQSHRWTFWLSKIKTERHLVESREVSTGVCSPSPSVVQERDEHKERTNSFLKMERPLINWWRRCPLWSHRSVNLQGPERAVSRFKRLVWVQNNSSLTAKNLEQH